MSPNGIATVNIRDEEVQGTHDGEHQSQRTLERIAKDLPDMDLLLTEGDGPRVLFNHLAPGAHARAQHRTDSEPFYFITHSTTDVCVVPMEQVGFWESANEYFPSLISNAKSGFALDMFLSLSKAKISTCFSDILLPNQNSNLNNVQSLANTSWKKKRSKLYWLDSMTGGRHESQTLPKLIELSQNHTDTIEGPYSLEVPSGYKYILDLVMNGVSNRFIGFLKSGSLMFKATPFVEYFTAWLRPYEHYIPVRTDLADLLERVAWAETNPEEVLLIQERGWQFTQRVMTEVQKDCYLFAVLLEWAQLQDYARLPQVRPRAAD